MQRVVTVIALGLVVTSFGAGACSSKKTVVFVDASEVDAAPGAADPAIEDVAPEPPDAPPAPVEISEEQAKREAAETWDGFLKDGARFVRGMQNERIDILTQMRELKFEEETEAYKKRVSALADKIQDFVLGETAAQLETAPERLCAIIEEVRVEADQLIAEGNVELEKVGAELKVLDDKQAAGGDVFQKQFDKLEKIQKRWSAPTLAGKYAFLGLKSLIDEGLVIVDYGVQRARRKLVECLGKVAERPLSLDLAQKNLEHVLGRARKLTALPE